MTDAGPVHDITIVTRDQADRAGRRHDDEHLWRLARTDLLGLRETTD